MLFRSPDDSEIRGIEFCKAVIDDGVTSLRQLLERRREDPPETLMDWKPGVKK